MRIMLLVVLLAACGRDIAVPDAFVFCSDTKPLAPTFANMQVLFGACTSCHKYGVELDLTPAVSYANLVGKRAPNYSNPVVDESCGGILVVPGMPDVSYLYQKLTRDPPCAGVQMPRTDIGTSSTLIPCEQALVRDWIAVGAPNN